ncbi:MAG TPA: alpha/beta fold hydrolase, partial [Pirellulales bacterium]|nr:alpha/beta fold hydrolase [Pirellulales bacterium]
TVAVFYFFQTALIFPGSWGQGSAAAKFIVPTDAELISLTTPDGKPIKALFGTALPAAGVSSKNARRPTILYFYGNGMSLSACVNQFNAFLRLGVNVMIPEYLGYGLSGGRPSEQGCYETAAAAYDWLIHDPRVDPDKIIVGGWSLGGAVAIDLAAKHPLAGLFTASAFTSMGDTGQRLYPYLPVKLLLRHRFMSIEKIPKIKCPTILAHGRDDTLVPFSMCGDLAKAAGGPVTEIPIDGAGHNDFWIVGQRQVFQQLKLLIDRVASNGK